MPFKTTKTAEEKLSFVLEGPKELVFKSGVTWNKINDFTTQKK